MSIHSILEAALASDVDAIPFVREFEPEVRSALLEGAHVKTFEKGDRILEAGSVPHALCVVLDGMVELNGTLRDTHCSVHLMAEGDLIFPLAVLHGEPCLTSVNALTRSRILIIDRHRLAHLASQHPQLALALARVMGAQWRMAVRHIIDLKCRNAAERLAAFLLKFADHADEDVPELPFTKEVLAHRLGVSRETLSRVIQVVADNGIVLRGSRILVRNRRRAEKLCGPEPYPRRSERALDVHVL